jgi:hypothetical protein
MNLITNQSLSEKFTLLVVIVLLLLTAWGNALVLFAFSVLALIAGLLIFRKNLTRGATLTATVGSIIAIVIALIISLMLS